MCMVPECRSMHHPSPDYGPESDLGRPRGRMTMRTLRDGEDPIDYPADGGDDGDDEMDIEEDEDDDMDIDADEEDEDDEMDVEVDEEAEEEHPAPAYPVVVALPATAPSAEETEPFETDESAATPPPHPAYRMTARITIPEPVPVPAWSDSEVARLLAISSPPASPLSPWSSSPPQIPFPLPPPIPSPSLPLSPPSPVLSAPPPSPIRSLGYRAAMIRMRAEAAATSHSLPLPPPFILSPTRPDAPPPMPTSAPTSLPPLLLPSASRREDRPEVNLPPQKRLGIALGPRYEVGESSAAAAARPAGGLRADYGFVTTMDREIRRDPERDVGYGIMDSWDEIVETLQGAPVSTDTDSINVSISVIDNFVSEFFWLEVYRPEEKVHVLQEIGKEGAVNACRLTPDCLDGGRRKIWVVVIETSRSARALSRLAGGVASVVSLACFRFFSLGLVGAGFGWRGRSPDPNFLNQQDIFDAWLLSGLEVSSRSSNFIIDEFIRNASQNTTLLVPFGTEFEISHNRFFLSSESMDGLSDSSPILSRIIDMSSIDDAPKNLQHWSSWPFKPRSLSLASYFGVLDEVRSRLLVEEAFALKDLGNGCAIVGGHIVHTFGVQLNVRDCHSDIPHVVDSFTIGFVVTMIRNQSYRAYEGGYRTLVEISSELLDMVDYSYYDKLWIGDHASFVGLECLLEINDQICPRFILEFYSQYQINYSDKGEMFIEFVIQNQFFSYSLEEFAQILDIPCEGACVFTNKWSLNKLAYGVPTDGPYQTNPPSPDDIISSIRIDREGQVRRIRHEEEIDVLEYQVLTHEIEPTLKPLEKIIRENFFCLGGNWDHVPACLCYMLYCVVHSEK
ncbi:hypothetical protein Tco_0858464 [Tanacetum coccineum]|uniref:Uncharacterized protein n=1 Tax=Tanacetum coccineum TaxID=301880 RepID=A0ABQ5BC65_9ASTR